MKQINEYPAYYISKDGKIFTSYKPKTSIITDELRELAQIYDKSCGYYIVTLCSANKRQNKRVHRLLAEAFIPNPLNLPQVNHIDGNKLNNSLINLEWVTAKRDSQHAMETGLCDERTALHEVAVIQMDDDFNYIAEFKSMNEAYRVLGIHHQNISKVCRGIRPRAGGYRWKYKESVTTIPLGSRLK